MPKQLVYLVLLFLLAPSASFAQCSFDRYFSEGQRLERQRNFEEAILQYEAAAICSNTSDAERRQALAAIKNAQKERLAIVNRARREAERAQKEAEQAQRQAEAAERETAKQRDRLQQQLVVSKANELTTLAAKELESGNEQYGLDLAFWAYRKVESIGPMPNVKRNFGDAVLHNKAVLINEEDSLGNAPGPRIRTFFSRDGRYALTLTDNHTVQVWEIGRERTIARLAGHRGPVSAMVIAPDNDKIMTASADRFARIWSRSGLLLAELPHDAEVSGILLAPDGSQILTWDRGGIAKLWTPEGNLLATMSRHQAPILSAGFSPDNNALFTRGGDGLVMIWDKRGQPLSPQGIPHSGYVFAAQFAPDGQSILTGGANGAGGLWQLSGTPITRFQEPGATITAVDISPDGQLMLTTDASGFLRIRNAAGTELASIQAHNDWIAKAGFSPDGKKIFTFTQGPQDRVIKIWNTNADGLATLYGHTDDILSVSFLPDSDHLLSTSRDGSARLWDLEGDVILNNQQSPNQLIDAHYSSGEGHLLFASQREPSVFCPNPYAVLASLKTNPPPLSDDLKSRTGITEEDIRVDLSLANPGYATATNPGAFSVQLGVYRDASKFDLTSASRLGPVGSRNRGDLTIMSITGIATRAEAERIRNQARTAGFPGAFIDASAPPPPPATPEEPQAAPPDTPVAAPPSPVATPYLIRLGAFSKPELFDDSRVSDLGPVESRSMGQGLTIKLIGGITDLEEARRLLAIVQRRPGFAEAFIVIEENGTLKRVR